MVRIIFIRVALFFLLIMTTALTTSACDVIDPLPEVDQPDPKEKTDVINDLNEQRSEDAIAEILLMLPPTTGNLTVSPNGEYLLFTMAGAPIDPYHIISTETYEGEICDDWGIYWGEIEYLQTPGLEPAQVYAPHFSPDGKKLLYVGYELYDYENIDAAIYLADPGLPPKVFQQVDLSGDELIQGIRPIWKADQKGIYYLTAKGVTSYSSEEQQTKILHSAESLNGLVQVDSLAPYSFHVKDNFASLAYYYEGNIKIVTLETDHPGSTVYYTGLSDIQSIEFIFDGNYIALRKANIYDREGHWLEFLDLQTGVLVELDGNYLPAGYSTNDKEEMAFIKYNESNDFAIAILNSSLEEVKTVGIPEPTGYVIWLDEQWSMLGRNQIGYPLYKVSF